MSLIKPVALIQKHVGYVAQSYDCAFWSPMAMLDLVSTKNGDLGPVERA